MKTAVNSHAKYLSGGSDQYQRMVSPSNPYATEATLSNGTNFGSSSKKLNAHK